MSAVPTQLIQCSNPDCKVAETGKCVEGHEISACANYGKPPGAVEAPADESEIRDQNVVELPGADKLTVAAVALVLRREPSRVIAIVGPHDAGKTSLIAGLYDLFQAGPVKDAQFRGSQTLHAFEIACHDARAASERGTPHINRTPLGEVQFYHLAITRMPTGEALSLILADRAGEEYRGATDDVSFARDFVEVHRADTITLLLDGARLVNNLSRHNVRAEITLLIQALRDGEALTGTQRLAVVLTKLDEVNASANKDRALQDLDAEVSGLRDLFGQEFVSIEAFRIAASPKTDAAQRGTGVPELLDFWLVENTRTTETLSVLPTAMRVLDRLVPIQAQG